MAEIRLLRDTALATVINKDATLADGSRAAGDYDNSTELDLWCDVYLQVQYDTSAPTAGDSVAELYVLNGDGEATEVFPQGGDGTVGTDVDPQKLNLAGIFETRSPSLTVDEILTIQGVPLSGHTNRFVIKNVSGTTFDLTWELRIKPTKVQTV